MTDSKTSGYATLSVCIEDEQKGVNLSVIFAHLLRLNVTSTINLLQVQVELVCRGILAVLNI